MKRILIANRGEIACRVAKTAHAMGYETIGVFSDADRGARHTQVVDQAVHIGGSVAAESYLNVERLLEAAKKTGADAVHPGYGFLAENAGFAEACESAGLVFIGPTPEAIRLMGSKRQAKLRMAEADVPVVPGYTGSAQDVEVLAAEALKVGFPLMIKASAGGGGRGLRLVTEEASLRPALEAARAEATSAFADGELILERAVPSPRHVEIQVFADTHGNVVHLGERDCSVQRRHQKVIEEAPSPAVSEEIRQQMGAAAVSAAAAIGYRGAGTVEMLLDPDGQFYFMEMNTRLQVEHPVTELVTGQDLVAWQLEVAEGRTLPCTQDEIRMAGHAIEARVYAEDAYAGFLPQVGTARGLVWPEGEGVRVDHGLEEGQEVSAFYDAMVAKVMAYGRDREEARRRLCRALRQLRVGGLVTNRGYLLDILEHPEMVAGRATTAFIADHLGEVVTPPAQLQHWALAAALCTRRSGADAWRSTGWSLAPIRLATGEARGRFVVQPDADGLRVDVLEPVEALRVRVADAELDARDPRSGLEEAQGGGLRLAHLEVEGGDVFRARVEIDGVQRGFDGIWHDDGLELSDGDARHRFVRVAHSDAAAGEAAADSVFAPMAGKVVDVRVEANQAVSKGQILVVLEAMKMQMELVAERDGTVETVHIRADDQVDNKQLLVELASEEK